MSGVLVEIPAGVIVGPLAALALVVGVTMLARHDRATPRRVLMVVASVGYAAAALALTFFPFQIATGDHANRQAWFEKVNVLPLVTIDARTFVLNVLLFVPFGALLPWWRRQPCGRFTAARYALAASATIEVCQWLADIFLSSGRTADVNDLVANVGGAMLGFLVYRTVVGPGRTERLERWALARRPDPIAAGRTAELMR